MRLRLATLIVVVGCVTAASARTPQQPQPQRPPIFRANIDVVRVDVLAVDNGKPIAGLTPADFEVRDNGVLQTVDLATLADHVSAVIALDVRANPRWPEANREVIDAARVFAGELKPADRGWLVTFAQTFDLRVGPASDPHQIQSLLER